MNHLARPPLAIDLELVRAAETASPHGVATGEWNRYLLRDPDDSGRYEDGDFVWDESMQADLSATGDAASAGEAVKRLGAAMRAFIESAGWARIAARIQEARAAGRAVCLTVRSAAQELYTLPWELLDVGGAPVYQTDDCLLRYQRPGAGEPAAAPPAPSERVLVAWSGAVPAADHIDAIAAAASAGHVRFDRERDVLAHASVASIDKALRERPAAILHLLCHGQAIAGGQAYGLRLDGATGPAPPAAVRDLLAPHRHGLRLVVLAACLGSSAGAADNALGSVAQAIIEAGVPAVVASRYPLSTSGSTLLTRVLYQRLLVDLWSLARAFLDARAALRGEASEVRGLDAVAVQLHTGRTRSLDFWPWIIRPYRGLRAYDREDARLFFGREAERALLRGRMEAVLERGGPRFLLVAGASGTGKSSLVRAGLLADLQAATPSWSTEVMRPGEGAAPIERLARCLERHRGATARLALVVDQLEELFTEVSAPGQREAFLRELWRLACDPAAGVFVIATIRIEYLGHLGNVRRDDDGVGFDRELLDGDCLYIVRQLGPEQYARIIRGPAQAAGVLIEPGLLARLLHELRAQPGALPLLSYTLDHLWERRGFATQEIAWRHVTGQPDAAAAREDARVTGWWLTDAAYDAPGGIEGELAGSADAVYAQLGPDHQAELRRVLVQLVQGHEDVLLATRRRGWRQALRPGPETAVIFDQVVDMLVDARLLVQGSDGGPDDPVWIELAHDALIRFWPGLHRWYQEARAWLGQAEELRELAEDWRPHARGDDSPAAREREDPYLGLRGQRLSYHLEAWSHYRHHLGAEAQRLGQAFLDACVRAEAERIEAERARERAARRRTRVTAMVAVAVAAVMAVLGLWARGQQLVAEEQRSAADRGRSEAQAQRVEAEKQRAIAVEREAAARDASIMAGARALMARNQPAWATRLLEELPRPLDVHGWRVLAFEALSQTRLIVTLRGHEDAIHDLALSPDGELVATASSDGTARVWRTDGTGTPLVLRHESHVNAVVFSPDGELVATASSDGTARVWRADGAGAPLVCRHEGEVKAVDFSPDGELLVTASDDRTARLWRVDDAAQIAVLRAHDVAVLVAKFSPDGERVITGARDGTVRLWRVDDPGQSTALTGHRGPVMTADFSPDGKLAVTGSGDGTARIWRVDEPGSSVLLSGHERTIRSVSFSPAGRHVITASLDKTVRIWFVSDPTKFTIVERHTEMAWFAAFSPVGPRYMTAFSDGTVHLWDAGSETPVALAGHEGSVSAAAFSPDGERLVTASADGTARIWRTGEPDGFFTTLGDDAFRRERTISSAGFSADGTLVFSLASDGLAQVWRTDGSGQVATLGAPERRISAADLGPEGERVATVSSDGELRLWGVKDGREIAATHAHEDPIRSVRFSPDGTLVVTASRDGTARIWRPHGRGAEIEPIATLRGHEKALTSAAFSPDGALVITTSHDGAARIWRVADPAQVMVLRGPPGDNFGQIDSAAFSPDGKLVATNSARETCVWRIDEPGGARVLRRYPASDTPAQLSPDGLHVLTSMGDLAQVRRLQASDQAIILRGHSDRIISASFSPDGELVFTASRDGTARIWSVDAPEQPVVLEDGGTVHEAPFSPDGDLVLGHWRGRARIVPIGVEGLRAGLHRANQDCLGPRMRQRYLGEIEGDARHGYEDCELAYGRVPLDTRTSNAGGQP